MAPGQRLFIHETIVDLLFQFYVIACIANAVIAIVSFLLYVKTRLASREEQPNHTAELHAQKLDGLDRREQRYQSIHFITLALFVLFGVLILIQLSGKLNQGTITRSPGPRNSSPAIIIS